MSPGISTTFHVLGQTETETASRVLVRALDSPRADIQEAALAAILKRRNTSPHRELLERWDRLDRRWKETIKRNADRMTQAVRDALLSSDPPSQARACRAAVWLQEYDLLPALLNTLEDTVDPNADLVAQSLLGLADQLYADLAAPHDVRDGCDPQLRRQHVVTALEGGVQRDSRHHRREAIEAFLLLAYRDNAVLSQILQDPHHSAFLAVMEALSKSGRSGVIRLLLSFLEDPHAPSATLPVLSNRCDATFVRHLLRKLGRETTAAVRQNLKRITSVAWLRDMETFLEPLDEVGQQGAVRLAQQSGIDRKQALGILEVLLRCGKVAGRQAAAEALADFTGVEANALAMRSLDDPDPNVQALTVLQLRRRGIPGVLARLVELLESPHLPVRQAARKSLAEFNFKSFLGAFDMLDEDVRKSTGLLVKKIDVQTMPLLEAELRSKVRTRRMRGLAMARVLGAVGPLEPTIVALLSDDDHMVRVEAAGALAGCQSDLSRQALEDALADRSEAVQEAARKALQARNQYDSNLTGPAPQAL